MMRVGETAWLVPLDSSSRVWTLAARVRAAASRAVREIVPGARSLLVVFREPPGESDRLWLEQLAADAEARAEPAADPSAAPPRIHVVPVTYDGPDLQQVARHAGLLPGEVVALHAGSVYRVAFVGFQPGFAYLEGLPERLRTPRRSSPRPRVPRGSVAIGGEWTGIYPTDSPGGWNLIGRTELSLFDAEAEPPARLAPGDVVRMAAR